MWIKISLAMNRVSNISITQESRGSGTFYKMFIRNRSPSDAACVQIFWLCDGNGWCDSNRLHNSILHAHFGLLTLRAVQTQESSEPNVSIDW